jgi:hypothetical protein
VPRSAINPFKFSQRQRFIILVSQASDKNGDFPSDQDPYEALFKSSLFKSDLVKAEFNR